MPLDGSRPSTFTLERRAGREVWSTGATLDPGGRLAAVTVRSPGHPEASGIRVVDLTTGDERAFDTHPEGADGCVEARE